LHGGKWKIRNAFTKCGVPEANLDRTAELIPTKGVGGASSWFVS